MRRLLLGAVPALLALVAASPAAGATTVCPGGGDVASAVETAPVVFVGTVQQIDAKGGALLVSVDEVWSDASLEPVVTIVNFGDINGAPLELASRYLFIPDSTGDLMTGGWCLPPVPLSSEIESLRPDEVTTPGGDGPEETTAEPIDLAPYALPAFVLVAIAISVAAFTVKGPSSS